MPNVQGAGKTSNLSMTVGNKTHPMLLTGLIMIPSIPTELTTN